MNIWTADLSKKRSLNDGMTASYPGVSLLIEMQKNEGPEQEAEKMTFQRSELLKFPARVGPCPSLHYPLPPGKCTSGAHFLPYWL